MEREFWEMWFSSLLWMVLGDFMRVNDAELKINNIAYILNVGNDGYFFFSMSKRGSSDSSQRHQNKRVGISGN